MKLLFAIPVTVSHVMFVVVGIPHNDQVYFVVFDQMYFVGSKVPHVISIVQE